LNIPSSLVTDDGLKYAFFGLNCGTLAVGTPKTGYMIAATGHNIYANLEGGRADRGATCNAIYLADFGDSGAVFVAIPQILPRNVNWFPEGVCC
jgi:hypothetical protein